MKLIIELDEKRFKDIQRIASIQIRRRSLTCEQIIANGTPLEEELKNIKAEIKPYCWKIKRENEYLVVELEDVNFILDNHIKENKQ